VAVSKEIMNTKIIIGLIVLMFISGVSADYLWLHKEDLYCERFGIAEWCTEEGIALLENQSEPTQDVLDFYVYLNDLAFTDEIRYAGELKIRSINVNSDITDESQVEASYVIENPSESQVTVHITALNAPITTKTYENGKEILEDPQLDGWNSTFAPGEEKEIIFSFSEPLYGEIFGYNINLLFDYHTVDNHITPEGNYVFILPVNSVILGCAPNGYSASRTGDERIIISWRKEDFVPWTNSFNDLICEWTIAEVLPPISPEDESGDGEDDLEPANYTIITLLLVIAFLAFLIYLKKIHKIK